MKISIIIPTYNEEKEIENTLRRLFRNERNHQVIIADGFSGDRTEEISRRYKVNFVRAPKGRAQQLNEGSLVAEGDILLFLHADCILPRQALEAVVNTVKQGYVGGCFSQRINSDRGIYRLIELSGNIRARLLRVFYGDQAIFVRKDVFYKMGGFDSVELCDDIIFSKKLRKYGKTCILKNRVLSSPRRWEKQGIVKTTFINWIVTVGFICGISPSRLSKIYREVR